jgi:O-antigen ligase
VAGIGPTVPTDVLHRALFVLTVLNISRLHQMYEFLGMLRPGLLLTGIALCAAVMKPESLGKNWMSRPTTKMVVGLLVLTLGSIAFGISQGAAFYFFKMNYYKILVGAFLVMAAIRDPRDVWFFAWAYFIGAALLVYQALFVAGMTMEGNVARLSGLFNWDANDIGLLLLIGIPIGMWLWRTASTKARIFIGLVLLGSTAAIARSGSRGAFVGFVALGLAYLWMARRISPGRKIAIALAIVAALVVAAPAGYWEQMRTITNLEQDYNTTARQGRKQLALRGLGYMFSYPIFGIGVGNFGRAEGMISSIAQEAALDPSIPGIKWSAPHNTFIQAGAEMGIGGLILFTALVLYCIAAPWMLRRVIPESWERGTWEQQFMAVGSDYLPLATVAFAVPSLFLSFAYSDAIYILAALAGGMTTFTMAMLARSPARRAGAGRAAPRVAPPGSSPIAPAVARRFPGPLSAQRGLHRATIVGRRPVPPRR